MAHLTTTAVFTFRPILIANDPTRSCSAMTIRSINWMPKVACWRCSIEASSARSACTGPAGWIAFADRRTGFVLCMHFPYQPDAEYPDNGATVECWTESPGAPSPIPIRSPGYILEAEVLSPLLTLHPLQIAMQQVTWSAAYCPAPIVAVTDVGCVHQPLSINLSEGWARIRGIFGCFLAGRAELECRSEAGDTLSATDLGPVSPLSVLNVDTLLRVKDGTARISLNILDLDGTDAGTLSSVRTNDRD